MYSIIDIETTGNGLKGNRITEIAIFRFNGDTVVDEFTSLVNPMMPIPYYITGLTGITDAMVQNAPTFEQISERILEMTKDCVFVAHSVNFDYGVVREEFKRIDIPFVRKKLCTVRLSRKLVPGLKSYSLGKLCKSLNIPLHNRHRAKGDAEATVLLFKRLLALDPEKKMIKSFLNARSREATLPPLLPKHVVNNLPESPGIYFFKNNQGDIIYVGKAINLKKRVLGHFYDKSNHEIRLCREIADIDFELSGSETLALLMESAAIKAHYPLFNRAQKKRSRQYALFSYEDRAGIVHLAFGQLKDVPTPLLLFNNQTECRAYLENLCFTHKLCPKYCQLQKHTGACNHYKLQGCEGICCGEEPIANYNKKVSLCLETLQTPEDTFILEEKGRHADEKAFIYVENGVYKGYGFVENHTQLTHKADLEAHLIQQQQTVETKQILSAILRKKQPTDAQLSN